MVAEDTRVKERADPRATLFWRGNFYRSMNSLSIVGLQIYLSVSSYWKVSRFLRKVYIFR